MVLKRIAIIIMLYLSSSLSNNSYGGDHGKKGMLSEPVFTNAPFKECHASTIAETPNGFAVAFFAGSAEKSPDVGIWLCRQADGVWTAPVEVVNGIQSDNLRYPCWNPVLFQVKNGPLMLFYKVGPNPQEWWGMLITSDDSGRTWSKPVRLPDNILGAIKNKPVMLKNGTLLCPSSIEKGKWQATIEITADTGKTWTRVVVPSGEKEFNVIQPAILLHPGGRLQLLCRSRENCIVESWSDDNGHTWSPLSATTLPNNNSGIDAVSFSKRKHFLVYNPTTVPEGRWTGDRTPLSLAFSHDGKKWENVLTLESQEGEFSYPSIIKASDNSLHIVYTWKRKTIQHVVLKSAEAKYLSR
jgi:predicted neuraminidase